jgi:acylphosphatase
MSAAMERWRFVVDGVVQGVGFRWFVVRRAQHVGLAGWVRNLPDGRVEVVAEGPTTNVEALAKALAEGPPQANVTRVDRSSARADDEFPQPFEVR